LVLAATLGYGGASCERPRTSRNPPGTIDSSAEAGGPSTDAPTYPDAPPLGDARDGGGTACTSDPGIPRRDGEACICDGQCASGSCQQGVCCAGSGCGRRALGEPCQRAEQCESGACADGVCCNVACEGTCVSCNQPQRNGDCMPVPAGQKDPRARCPTQAAETCGLTGFCNGQGGCSKYAPTTPCGMSACSGPYTFIPGGECDGEGRCIKGQALECTPFTCEGATCRSNCVTNADCVAPHVCAEGRCGLRGKGQACSSGDQCGTGNCVDGVCCENACQGRCLFCAAPDSRGTCAPVRAGAPDPRAAAGVTNPALICLDQGVAACGTNGRCDGSGGCQRYDNGSICRAARCDSGANAETGDSLCMNGTCRAPAAVGCAPYRGCTGARCLTRCGGDDQCASGFFCVDGLCGKRPTGSPCTRGSDCLSTNCAQGRCCATPCDAACRACNLAGSLGTCAPVAASAEDTRCGDSRCSGCDGNGACTRTPGASCGDLACGTGANQNATVTSTCNAAGACILTPTPCPMGETCSMGACGCGGTRARCQDVCVDLQTNHDNCGECGNSCNAFRCVNGGCVPP
jgi:hypothetical protein